MLAKYRRNSASGSTRLPDLPVGRSRMSTSYNRPIGPIRLAVLMTRCASSVKYSRFDSPRDVLPSSAYTSKRSRSLW